jgi:hypothetical protein
MTTLRSAPRDCPVCGARLMTTRLGCQECGTELSGSFEPCDFCALNREERSLLRMFLASRGNIKDLERQLGVSYPTARGRVDALLAKLGLASERPPSPDQRLSVLEALARGEIDIEQAEQQLGKEV